jgi:hypothetical protein
VPIPTIDGAGVPGPHLLDVAGGAPELIDEIRPIGDQAAGVDEDTIVVDRGQLVAGRQLDDQVAMKSYPAAAGSD